MISNNDFRKILQDKSLTLSKAELEQIIDEELKKAEDMMDTDLIEYCLDHLNELESDNVLDIKKEKAGDTNGIRMKTKYKRIAVIAAAVFLLFAGILSVSALVFNGDLFDNIVEFYDDNIRIYFDNSNDHADEYKLLGCELAKELADNGITSVLLPEALLTDECKITSVTYEKLDKVISVTIHYTQHRKNAYMTIDQYDPEVVVPYIDYLHSSKRIEMIEISNLPIYIMEQNGKGTIAYQNRSTVYYIVTPLSFEKTIQFAKTIK